MYHSLQQGKGKIWRACLFDKRLKFSYRSPPAVDMSLWRHLLNNVVASGRKDFFRLEKFRTIKLQPPLNGSQSISPIGSISAIQAHTIKVNLHTIQSLDSRHNPDTFQTHCHYQSESANFYWFTLCKKINFSFGVFHESYYLVYEMTMTIIWLFWTNGGACADGDVVSSRDLSGSKWEGRP